MPEYDRWGNAVVVGRHKVDYGIMCAFVYLKGLLAARCPYPLKTSDGWNYHQFGLCRVVDGVTYGTLSYYDKHYYAEDRGEELYSHVLWYAGKKLYATAYKPEFSELELRVCDGVARFAGKCIKLPR